MIGYSILIVVVCPNLFVTITRSDLRFTSFDYRCVLKKEKNMQNFPTPWMKPIFLTSASICRLHNTACSFFNAIFLLLICDFSVWHSTAKPVGIWTILTALSVVFTCWPPAPVALFVSIFKSFSFIVKSTKNCNKLSMSHKLAESEHYTGSSICDWNFWKR